MAKKLRKKRTATPANPRRSWWLWAVITAAVVLVGSGLSMLLVFGSPDTTSGGTPDLVVDQTVIDEGYVKLNTPVRTSFILRNEGDGLLQVLGEPQVQLVEGC